MIMSLFTIKIVPLSLRSKKFVIGLKISGAGCLGVSLCMSTLVCACTEYRDADALIIYGLIDTSSAVVQIN